MSSWCTLASIQTGPVLVLTGPVLKITGPVLVLTGPVLVLTGPVLVLTGPVFFWELILAVEDTRWIYPLRTPPEDIRWGHLFRTPVEDTRWVCRDALAVCSCVFEIFRTHQATLVSYIYAWRHTSSDTCVMCLPKFISKSFQSDPTFARIFTKYVAASILLNFPK